jgi:hypothetical protein
MAHPPESANSTHGDKRTIEKPASRGAPPALAARTFLRHARWSPNAPLPARLSRVPHRYCSDIECSGVTFIKRIVHAPEPRGAARTAQRDGGLKPRIVVQMIARAARVPRA